MITIILIAVGIFYTFATGKNIKDGDTKNAVLCALIASAAFYFGG